MVFSMTLVLGLSTTCAPTVSLVNQDPYPATPGDYVKIVFQVDGIADPACGDIQFELLEKYPITFDPNSTKKISLKSGTFAKDYSSHLIVPYKVRVDHEAVDGDNPIEVQFSNMGATGLISQEFNLNIEDSRADFEVYVKDFDSKTNYITLEILNIAKINIQAATVEATNSVELKLKGSKTNIIGDLDSNEYTTTEFEIAPQKATLNLNVYYTDNAGTRRTAVESVEFDPLFFELRKADEKQSSSTPMIVGVVVVLIIIYFVYKRRKNKKRN